MDLPIIDLPRDELDRTHLKPFRDAVRAGSMGIMTAHLAVPSIDPAGLPATLSRPLTDGLLRGELGFDGLVVSDSLRMDAITRYTPPGEAELKSVLAGTDILLSPFLDEAFERLVAAVRQGKLPEERLDRSVRRILTAKSWCDLHDERFVDVNELPHRIGTERGTVDDARRLARASVTLVKNEGGILPLQPARAPKVLGILYYDHPLGDAGAPFLDTLRKRAVGASRDHYEEGIPDESANIATVTIPCDSDPRFEEDALRLARASDIVICAFMYRIIMRRGTSGLRPRAGAFVKKLTDLGVPVAVVSFCSPYIVEQCANADAFVAAYYYSPLVQEAVVEALFGEIPFSGSLPVKCEPCKG